MSGPQKANDLLGQIPKTKGLPPVHLWNPDFCGDIDMRIARDGTGTTWVRPSGESRWSSCSPPSSAATAMITS